MTEVRPLTSLTLENCTRSPAGMYPNKSTRLHIRKRKTRDVHAIPRAKLEQPIYKEILFRRVKRCRHMRNYWITASALVSTRMGRWPVCYSEVHTWNNSLQLHDFHIAEEYRGRGFGRQLMERVVSAARDAVCGSWFARPRTRTHLRSNFTNAWGLARGN
jgi:GNAT superfamily N-acetyltransferase